MTARLALGGRAAIVAGAGNGLGRAEALALAAAGARLVLNDLPGDTVEAAAAEIRDLGGGAAGPAGAAGGGGWGERSRPPALRKSGRLTTLVNKAACCATG